MGAAPPKDLNRTQLAQLMRYCAKDVGYTRALVDVYAERLGPTGLARYGKHYRQVTAAALEMTITGFRVDHRERARIARAARGTLRDLGRQLEQDWGAPLRTWWEKTRGGTPGRLKAIRLVAKKGLSNPYCAAVVYDQMGCRPLPRMGRSCNELALRRLMRRVPKVRPFALLILAYRAAEKQAQFASSNRVDDDGRFRALYTPTAKTGRFRSKKNPLGTGGNGQNIPREGPMRGMFIPEKGHVLVEVDESQAEDRIVGGMSGNRELMQLALAGPEVDVHRLNAALVFDVDPEEVTPDQRQLGKKTKHACNYGMGGERMAEVALVETEGQLVLDPDECEEWIERLKAARPGIEQYQAWVRQQLITRGRLVNSWGRVCWFRGLRISQEDYKEAYAWMAQSEVGVLLNQGAFLPARKWIRQRGSRAKIVQQGHDSLVVSCPPEDVWPLLREVVATLSAQRRYPGAGGEWELAMPVGVKIGHNWREMREWKTMPARAEVMAHVAEAIKAGKAREKAWRMAA